MTATIERGASAAPAATAKRFNAYAVRSRTGPHVTMQAGVIHAGRLWTTTSASSLKARSVSAHGRASAVVPEGDLQRIIAGRTVAMRPFRPWRVAHDPIVPLFAPLAVARLGLSNLEQIVGYIEASGSIPSEWIPTSRVLLVTRIERSLTLHGDSLVDSSGSWSHNRVDSLGTEPSGSWADHLPLELVPSTHRSIVHAGARAHLGVATPAGPVALPARWVEGSCVAVSAPALAAITADLAGRGTAVFDSSESRRPDEKLGVMFRGSLRLVDVDGDEAVVGVSTERITTWDGFDATTVSVGR